MSSDSFKPKDGSSLGLERKQKPTASLAEVLAQHEEDSDSTATNR